MNKPVMMAALLFTLAGVSYADDGYSLQAQQPTPLQTNPKTTSDASALRHPDQLQTLVETEAIVQTTDTMQHTLVANDMTGHPITLKLIANTQILDPQNHPLALTDLKPKDHVRLYYDRKDNTVQQIDRLTSIGDAILGR